jgi:cytochrome b6
MANSSPVYDWFQERLEIQDIADDFSTKYVPPHVNIFIAWAASRLFVS